MPTARQGQGAGAYPPAALHLNPECAGGAAQPDEALRPGQLRGHLLSPGAGLR